MIGYWHHTVVRLSDCPSVCLSVTLCNMALLDLTWLSGLVYRAKSLKGAPACS